MDACMTDRELLSQYASGDDQGAFAELIGRHGNWVYSCAKRLVRQGDVAEDVAQAVASGRWTCSP